MTESERLIAQAELCDELARWIEQPDVPTGVPGWLSSDDLHLRAAALRAQLVLHER